MFSDFAEIYRVSIDGGTPEKLTAEGKTELAPVWSPDGKSIAFNDYPVPGHALGIRVLIWQPERFQSCQARKSFTCLRGRPMENT